MVDFPHRGKTYDTHIYPDIHIILVGPPPTRGHLEILSRSRSWLACCNFLATAEMRLGLQVFKYPPRSVVQYPWSSNTWLELAGKLTVRTHDTIPVIKTSFLKQYVTTSAKLKCMKGLYKNWRYHDVGMKGRYVKIPSAAQQHVYTETVTLSMTIQNGLSVLQIEVSQRRKRNEIIKTCSLKTSTTPKRSTYSRTYCL